MEEWRFIKDTNNNYQVSNKGKVRSVYRVVVHSDGKVTNHKSRILKQQNHKKGYKVITINTSGKKRTLKIHRLVAECFIENKTNKNIVNHKDGNKENNNSCNLEWVNNQENVNHAWANGLNKNVARKGSCNGQSILTEEQVLDIRSKYIPNIITRKDLAQEYNVTVSCIKDILTRRSWKHV